MTIDSKSQNIALSCKNG